MPPVRARSHPNRSAGKNTANRAGTGVVKKCPTAKIIAETSQPMPNSAPRNRTRFPHTASSRVCKYPRKNASSGKATTRSCPAISSSNDFGARKTNGILVCQNNLNPYQNGGNTMSDKSNTQPAAIAASRTIRRLSKARGSRSPPSDKP